MSENVTGYGTILARGAATGTSLPAYAADVYSAIIDIEDLVPPSPSRQTEEWYVLDKKASKKLVGSISYAPATGTVTRAFDDTVHDSLEDDANAAAAVRRNWYVQMPNAGQQLIYFVGYVSKFEIQSVTNQGRIQYALEITVDGEITIVR